MDPLQVKEITDVGGLVSAIVSPLQDERNTSSGGRQLLSIGCA